MTRVILKRGKTFVDGTFERQAGSRKQKGRSLRRARFVQLALPRQAILGLAFGGRKVHWTFRYSASLLCRTALLLGRLLLQGRAQNVAQAGARVRRSEL